jgi:hypothetical protein
LYLKITIYAILTLLDFQLGLPGNVHPSMSSEDEGRYKPRISNVTGLTVENCGSESTFVFAYIFKIIQSIRFTLGSI